MTYRSILVNLDIDGPVVPLIKLATDLASRFDAHLIGFSAADVTPPIIVAEGMALGVAVSAQFEISRWSDSVWRSDLVTPPNAHSRSRLCPYPPETIKSALASRASSTSASGTSA